MKNILFGSVVAATLVLSGCGSSSSSSTPASGNDNNGTGNQGGGNDNNGTGNQGGGNDNNGTGNQGGGNENNDSSQVSQSGDTFTVGGVTWTKPTLINILDDNNQTIIVPTPTWQQAKDYCTNLQGGWRLPTKDEALTLVKDSNDTDPDEITYKEYSDAAKASLDLAYDNGSIIWLGEDTADKAWILYVKGKKTIEKLDKDGNNGYFTCVK